MNAQTWEELPDETKGALLVLAEEQRAEIDRKRYLHTPFEDTRAKLISRLESEGTKVGVKRFCWLRLRMHRYRLTKKHMATFYRTGTPAHGQTRKLCIDCGHDKIVAYIGYNPAPR